MLIHQITQLRRIPAVAIAGVAALLAAGLCSSAALAVPPTEALLPKTTKGYVSSPDFEKLQASFDKTQWGAMLNDPVMEPFAEDLRKQMKQRWGRVYEKLGLTLDDLKGVPAGEVAMALIQPAEKTAALAILFDVTGHEAQVKELLDKIDRNMTKQKATKAQKQVGKTEFTIYTLPKQEKQAIRQAVFFQHDDVLVGAENEAIAAAILGRFAAKDAPAADSLAKVEAFIAVMERAARSAGEARPDARWFIEPFGFVDAMRALNAGQAKKKGKDFLKILSEQGFKAVQGIGGFIDFDVDGKYEMIHRTAIYAPAVKGVPEKEKYTLGARMLRFPNGGDLHPEEWVPRELATYGSFNLDIPNMFEYSSTLVDAIVGEEGVFVEVIRSLEHDPTGPRISVRKDVIAHLGKRAAVITDYALPITPKCERMVVAIEATNPDSLAKTIERVMKADPATRRIDFQGHVIWEIVQEEEEGLPKIKVAGAGFDALDDDDEDMEEKKRRLPNSAVCVAGGHIFWSTHVDFLERVLTKQDQRETLAESVDYLVVMGEVEKLSENDRSFRFFSRTDEEYRPTYELIRMGKMPESQTVFGKLLNSMFSEGKEGEVRSQKVDGRRLPDFETVRRYFGPCGTSIVSEEKGWFVVGVFFNKEMP